MIARLFSVLVLTASAAGCVSKPSSAVSLSASSVSGFGIELQEVTAKHEGKSIQTVGFAKRAQHFGLIDAHLHLEFLDDRGSVLGDPIEKRLPSIRKHKGWEPLMRFSWNDDVQTPFPTAVRVSVKPGEPGKD